MLKHLDFNKLDYIKCKSLELLEVRDKVHFKNTFQFQYIFTATSSTAETQTE